LVAILFIVIVVIDAMHYAPLLSLVITG
jgi:hypothetical protein